MSRPPDCQKELWKPVKASGVWPCVKIPNEGIFIRPHTVMHSADILFYSNVYLV